MFGPGCLSRGSLYYEDAFCLRGYFECIADAEAGNPDDVVIGYQYGYILFVGQRHPEVDKEVAQLLILFHTERCKGIAGLPGAPLAGELQLVKIQLGDGGIADEREVCNGYGLQRKA